MGRVSFPSISWKDKLQNLFIVEESWSKVSGLHPTLRFPSQICVRIIVARKKWHFQWEYPLNSKCSIHLHPKPHAANPRRSMLQRPWLCCHVQKGILDPKNVGGAGDLGRWNFDGKNRSVSCDEGTGLYIGNKDVEILAMTNTVYLFKYTYYMHIYFMIIQSMKLATCFFWVCACLY